VSAVQQDFWSYAGIGAGWPTRRSVAVLWSSICWSAGSSACRAATLSLDGNTVGAIGHPYNGGVEFHPLNREFSRADLDVFVDACRWRGRAASRDTVLEALAAEYGITTRITAVEADGLALIVLRDGDEHVVSTDYRLGRNEIGAGGMQMLAVRLTAAAAVPRGDNPAGAR
jgi:hypothetical protein